MSTTKYVNFKTVREDFNVYEIPGKFTLRSKQSIISIKTDDNNMEFLRPSLRSVSIIEPVTGFSVSELKQKSVSEVTDDDITDELKFVVTQSSMNIYETEREIIIIDDPVEHIFMTHYKDENDIPIIRFRSNIGMNIIPKREPLKNDELLK